MNYPLDKIDSIPNSIPSHAGFIYSPRSIEDDRVRCMYCQCALDYWEEDDDPIQNIYEMSPLIVIFLIYIIMNKMETKIV